MPYVITTRPGAPGLTVGRYEDITRTAVATLEGARDKAHETVHAAYRAAYPLKPHGLGGEHSDAQRAHRWHNVDVDKLPESGGTIGPLPDGTVIEVWPMSWREAIRESGIARRQPSYWFAMSNPTAEERASILAAFNAA